MRRGVAQLVDLVVPAGVLLDVRIRPGQVRLGLVVVEVADEVLDRVVREERPELGVQLRRKRLVVGQDERRLLVLGYHLGKGKGLARSGSSEQRLVTHPLGQPGGQPLDRGGLVAGRREIGDELEVGHARRVHNSAITEQVF